MRILRLTYYSIAVYIVLPCRSQTGGIDVHVSLRRELLCHVRDIVLAHDIVLSLVLVHVQLILRSRGLQSIGSSSQTLTLHDNVMADRFDDGLQILTRKTKELLKFGVGVRVCVR